MIITTSLCLVFILCHLYRFFVYFSSKSFFFLLGTTYNFVLTRQRLKSRSLVQLCCFWYYMFCLIRNWPQGRVRNQLIMEIIPSCKGRTDWNTKKPAKSPVWHSRGSRSASTAVVAIHVPRPECHAVNSQDHIGGPSKSTISWLKADLAHIWNKPSCPVC